MTMQTHKRSGEAGLTLIELLASIAIAAMVAGILVNLVWMLAVRAQRLTSFNAAQEKVLTVNHALNRMLRSSDFVQMQFSGNPASSSAVVVLWLYRGGYPTTAAVDADRPWMYNTTTVVPTVSGGQTAQAAIVGATCFKVFEFIQRSASSWDVYSVNANNAQAQNQTPPAVNGTPLASGVDIEWMFPVLYPQGSGTDFSWTNYILGFLHPSTISSGTFVNSFIMRLSAPYQSSTGQTLTYDLASGYHDADVR
ncbi:hypothetical protein Alches_21060 [Alicyclobacillus hesperidum subsp. aegles]|uniref:prepilin-type N-terminal cleavage/methylation domain-containing protein n=1 Tax=Alicyclobacillus hesperidum TaxID=89784 RepID=UPI0007192040|nr:prepilin-type N-terminal cleavage/methylation domain-containing protein [Alicyclobacillus hesperidum]KRW92284.1 hypothetical protein SD51_04400 [Alicyclobacillus tengchongensis]GLG02065.1 hypothetical protein Alches_21060 [Alicyclobacillus hesperidum subsp. aegles]